MITTYLPDGAPRIELAAEMAGTTVRTLQRLLAREHLTYSRLVSQARFAFARELLDQTGLSIAEIAREAGYRHVSHFSRAFRNIAGVSPNQYRHRREEQA
jgi:AraC-like DNA-binding protein